MKKILMTTFCLSILIMFSQSVMAQDVDKTNPLPQRPKMEKGHKPPHVNLDELLNLTDEQKAKVKANRIKSRKAMKPVMDDIRNKREAILDVIDSDLSKDAQEAKIKALQEDIKALHKKANKLREQNMKEFENILTPEQKAKFEQFKKEHKPPKHVQKTPQA